MRNPLAAIFAVWTALMSILFGFGLLMIAWSLKFILVDGNPMTMNKRPMGFAESLAFLLVFSVAYLGMTGIFAYCGLRGMHAASRGKKDRRKGVDDLD